MKTNNLYSERRRNNTNKYDSAVLGCLLTTAGVRADAPALISRMFDEFGSFKGILEARQAQLLKITQTFHKLLNL